MSGGDTSRVWLIVWTWLGGCVSLLAYCKSIWRWDKTLNRYLWQYCSLPRQLLVLLTQPIRVQLSHHLTLSPPMGGTDRWLMIILDGSFISIFSLWAGLIRVYVIWSLCGRERTDTSQDICQYQELSPCYPQPVLTTTLPINLPTNHFQPPDFVLIYMYAPCNTFTIFKE